MSRWRSFLPDLMTVKAVMVRAALEKSHHNCVTAVMCLDSRGGQSASSSSVFN